MSENNEQSILIMRQIDAGLIMVDLKFLLKNLLDEIRILHVQNFNIVYIDFADKFNCLFFLID